MKGGHLSVPLSCTSDSACTGELSITYVTVHGRRIHSNVCTKAASIEIAPHKHVTVRVQVRGSCARALKRHHKLSAELSLKVAGHTAVTKQISLVL